MAHSIFPTKKQNKQKARTKTKAKLNKTNKNNKRKVTSNLISKSVSLGSVVWVKESAPQAPFHFANASATALCWSDSVKSWPEYWIYHLKVVLDQALTASYLLKRLASSSRSGSPQRGFFIAFSVSSSTSPVSGRWKNFWNFLTASPTSWFPDLDGDM